jgi:hypothetical protein
MKDKWSRSVALFQLTPKILMTDLGLSTPSGLWDYFLSPQNVRFDFNEFTLAFICKHLYYTTS